MVLSGEWWRWVIWRVEVVVILRVVEMAADLWKVLEEIHQICEQAQTYTSFHRPSPSNATSLLRAQASALATSGSDAVRSKASHNQDYSIL